MQKQNRVELKLRLTTEEFKVFDDYVYKHRIGKQAVLYAAVMAYMGSPAIPVKPQPERHTNQRLHEQLDKTLESGKDFLIKLATVSLALWAKEAIRSVHKVNV